MKPREYCCCAIPMINPGIFATIAEQAVAGILIGALSVGTPSIVGAATPSFAGWLLGIICFVVAALQILGFIGVTKEKPILFRRYVTLHGIALCAAFSVAAAWIIISATRHSTAASNCLQRFFSADALQDQGQKLCEIFAWVDVGIMGGLWVLLAILQGYLFFVLSSYGSSQRKDHEQYDALSDPTHPLTKDTILMADRNDPWESGPEFTRPSPDANGAQYHHLRQFSTASASDILNEPQQKPDDSLSGDYGYKSSYYTMPQGEHSLSRPPPATSYSGGEYFTGTSYQKSSQPVDRLI